MASDLPERPTTSDLRLALESHLAEGAARVDHPALIQIADLWSQLLRPDQMEALNAENLLSNMVHIIETGDLHESQQITLASTLRELESRRRPKLSADLSARLNEVCRPILTRLADTLNMAPRRLPLSKVRRAHVIFAGADNGNVNERSAPAIDYAAALALDTRVERIEIVHSGSISRERAADIRAILRTAGRRPEINFVSTLENDDFMVDLLGRGPCTFHFCGEPSLSPVISLASRLGPTVMFVGSDETPVQYADVYWNWRSTEMIADHWARQGAPSVFARNHLQVLQVPGRTPPVRDRLSREALGLAEDAVVIATVGGRLEVEMDEAYITGIELAIRDRPNCYWLVAGELPDFLSDACRQVLGARFLYIPHPGDLGGLMTIADIFANPFREAGGSDARLAAAAGAAILTLDRGEVAAVAPADFLGLDTEDYFRRLAALIEAPELLAALKSHQAEHLDQIGDPEILIANLNKIVRVASDRYEGRGRGAPLSETVFAPPPRLAVAS